MANDTGQPPEHEPPESQPTKPPSSFPSDDGIDITIHIEGIELDDSSGATRPDDGPLRPMDAVAGCVQLVGLTARLLLLLGLLVLVLAFVWAAITL